ncbi:hypothetical protein C0Q70_09600 [Pomacea canaliculata]|uniref:Uncharacterized protein n=1 Tax=Pomacea canaliculata TaxID=400727 RepID=A0A2T7PAA3_POMCA|nr:hypothetical protein C0Q70_09600 [Pomacea canaliculata]
MLKFVLLVCLVLTVTQAVKYHKSKLQFAQKRSLMVKRQATICGENQFLCTSGECILSEWTCDTQADCADGSDEKECECVCRGDRKFQCHNGHCIPASFVCDLDNDCGDNSDEIDCECDPTTEFRCNNGQCINIDWRCDNDADCFDASDELGCPEPSEGLLDFIVVSSNTASKHVQRPDVNAGLSADERDVTSYLPGRRPRLQVLPQVLRPLPA